MIGRDDNMEACDDCNVNIIRLLRFDVWDMPVVI